MNSRLFFASLALLISIGLASHVLAQQVIECEVPVSGVVSPGEERVYRLVLDEERTQTISVTAGNATSSSRSRLVIDLLRENGSPEDGGSAFVNLEGAGNRAAIFSLAPGNYDFRVRAGESGAVSYRMEITVLSQDCVEEIVCGDSLSRTLALGESDVFAFSLDDDTAMSITAANTTASTSSRLILDLMRPDGSFVEGGEAFIEFESDGSQVSLFTLAAGDYRLRIRTGETISVTYRIEAVFLTDDRCVETLSCSTPTSARLAIGESDVFAFSLDDDTAMSITAANTTASTSSRLILDLMRPDGSFVEGGEAFIEFESDGSQVSLFTLAASDYRLRIRTGETISVTYRIEAVFLTDDRCVETLNCSTPTSARLAIGESDVFAFSLDDDTALSITAANTTASTSSRLILDLMRPDGSFVDGGEAFIEFESDGSQVSLFTLAASDYRLRIRTGETISVTYRIEAVFLTDDRCVETLNCSTPTSARLAIGESDVFAFSLDDDTALSITAANTTASTSSRLILDLMRPDGSFVDGGEAFIEFESDGSQVSLFTLAASDYRLRIRTGETVSVTYTIEIDCQQAPTAFTRGDANADSMLDVSDAVAILRLLFESEQEPVTCHKAADCDDNGLLEITDAVYLLRYLFSRGESLPEPLRVCGRDATADPLTCEAQAACNE